jgi:hypothetical protein
MRHRFVSRRGNAAGNSPVINRKWYCGLPETDAFVTGRPGSRGSSQPGTLSLRFRGNDGERDG